MTTRPALQETLRRALQGSHAAPTAPLSRVRNEGLAEAETQAVTEAGYCRLGCSCTLHFVHKRLVHLKEKKR